MPLYLLQLDLPDRAAEIVFASESDESAVADFWVHIQKRQNGDVEHAVIYPLAIGGLDRESGAFLTQTGDPVFDSWDDGEHDAGGVVGAEVVPSS